MTKEFKIEGIELNESHIDSKVTYIPRHANKDASHPDCEHGTIINWNEYGVMVNYIKNKARTPFELLVFG